MQAEPKTFDEWNALGYRIYKGAKSQSRNESGIALFTRDDVYAPYQGHYDDFCDNEVAAVSNAGAFHGMYYMDVD